MTEKRCYTVQELQEILGVSRPTIYNLLKKKEFRWIQLDGGKYRMVISRHSPIISWSKQSANFQSFTELDRGGIQNNSN